MAKAKVKRASNPHKPRRKAKRSMPWHFRDQILHQVQMPDGRDFVPVDVMAKAVDVYRARLKLKGPQPITEHFSSPSPETIQGYVSRISIHGSDVVISGRLEETLAGCRAQEFGRLVFGFSAVGVPEMDDVSGRFVYSSIRIIVISALEEAHYFRGKGYV